MQDAIGIPSAADHHVVPFKSRLFTFMLKNPVSQAAEEIPVQLSPQCHIPVKDLIPKLCHADSVSGVFLDLSQLKMNCVHFRFASGQCASHVNFCETKVTPSRNLCEYFPYTETKR